MPRQQPSSQKVHSMQKQPSVAHSSTAISNSPSSHNSHSSQIKPSFGQTLKEGFAFGVGNSIAHSFIQSIFGSTKSIPSSNPTPNQIEQETTISRSIGAYSTQDLSGQLEYLQCMKEGGTEEGCKQYMI